MSSRTFLSEPDRDTDTNTETDKKNATILSTDAENYNNAVILRHLTRRGNMRTSCVHVGKDSWVDLHILL